MRNINPCYKIGYSSYIVIILYYISAELFFSSGSNYETQNQLTPSRDKTKREQIMYLVQRTSKNDTKLSESSCT